MPSLRALSLRLRNREETVKTANDLLNTRYIIISPQVEYCYDSTYAKMLIYANFNYSSVFSNSKESSKHTSLEDLSTKKINST